jgi:allantoinase
MRIAVINPNASETVTDHIIEAAQEVAGRFKDRKLPEATAACGRDRSVGSAQGKRGGRAMSSALLHGAMVADEEVASQRDIWFVDGRVREVAPGLKSQADADELTDLTGYLVLPGAIDPHVHFEEAGGLDREDFASGTQSAAAGGITTVFDHPLGEPPITTAGLLRRKRDSVAGRAHVDFGLWGGAVPGNTSEFACMAGDGAFGFKAFMIGSEPSYPSLDDAQLLDAMCEVARIGSIMLVHAENATIIDRLGARLRAAGRRDGIAHAESRPPISEIEAVARAATLACHAGCRLEIVHLSTAGALDVVALAAARGHPVRSEVCPHFLALTDAELARQGPWARCTPPLRSSREVEALWERVLRGQADFLVSDHAPWLTSEKERGRDDIWQAPNGLVSLQSSNVVTLTEGVKRGLTLPQFVRLSATNVARWLGLYPRKGTLRPGSDADLAVYARGVSDVVRADGLLCKQKWTPYDGRQVSFRLEACMLRGSWVYKDGAIQGNPRGQFIPSAPAARHEGSAAPGLLA